ncbi:MAG: diguanylate cyclase [Thermonema sp.]|uniref:GAF domain-containing protein n=1 Tax=Thermonema TaxID=28194 RepID=UPI0005711FA9|nr:MULTISPECIES: GAF domain-containing protein [Thermonema]GIV39643.1 MAG: diguanylate cyclase [Thermonema sp.]
MAEQLTIPSTGTKKDIYAAVVPQIEALIASESDLVANLANIAAVLKQAFDFFWVGFYLVKDGQLVLGPFQGPLACTRIPFDKGVCGACYREKQTLIVPDVEAFPGHIACSSESRSEIVVPVLLNGEVRMVIDVDSKALNDFDEQDKEGLEQVAAAISRWLAKYGD